VSSFLHPIATCLQKKNPSCHISVSHLHVEAMPENPQKNAATLPFFFSLYKPTDFPLLPHILKKTASDQNQSQQVEVTKIMLRNTGK